MNTHARTPTLDDISLYFAFTRRGQPHYVMVDGRGDAVMGRLQCALPLLPRPTVSEAARIFLSMFRAQLVMILRCPA